MNDKVPYEWKDFLTDGAIITVAIGIILLIVGSFPELFAKILSFLSQMPLKKLTPIKPDKDQPWKVWAFVLGLNLLAWIGWYYMHNAPSNW